MNTKAESVLKRPVIFPGGLSTLPSERLKKLRRERDLVDQAILALTGSDSRTPDPGPADHPLANVVATPHASGHLAEL